MKVERVPQDVIIMVVSIGNGNNPTYYALLSDVVYSYRNDFIDFRFAKKNDTLRIQSLLRMAVEPKYLAEEVIIHPNHHLTR